MTWLQQVRHVFVRDLQRTIGALVLYVALLCVAVARAVEWSDGMHSFQQPMVLFVGLSAAVIIARVVLADSPTHVTAFWAMQPLQSSAVATSKLFYVLLLLMLCAGAVVLTLTSWDLQALAIDSATIGVFPVTMLLLLGTILIASACVSGTAVGIVAAGVFGLLLVVQVGLGVSQAPVPGSAWWTLALLLTLGLLVLIIRGYGARPSSRLGRGVLLSCGVLSVLFTAFSKPASEPLMRTMPHAAGATSGVSIQVPIMHQPECARGRLVVPVEIGSPSSWRVDMATPSVTLLLTDGASVHAVNRQWQAGVGVWGPMLPAGLQPRNVIAADSTGTRRTRRTGIVFLVPDGVCGRIATLTLRVRARTASGTEVLRVPLTGQARATSPGYRVHVLDAQMDAERFMITARSSLLGSADRNSDAAMGALDFALYNPSLNEVVLLKGSGAEDAFRAYDLPGLGYMAATQRLKRYDAEAALPHAWATWRDSAVLLVTAPVWREAGSLSASAFVGPSAPAPPAP